MESIVGILYWHSIFSYIIDSIFKVYLSVILTYINWTQQQEWEKSNIQRTVPQQSNTERETISLSEKCVQAAPQAVENCSSKHVYNFFLFYFFKMSNILWILEEREVYTWFFQPQDDGLTKVSVLIWGDDTTWYYFRFDRPTILVHSSLLWTTTNSKQELA